MLSKKWNKYEKILKKQQKRSKAFYNKLCNLEEKYCSHEWNGYKRGAVNHLSERYISCPASRKKTVLVNLCNRIEETDCEIDKLIYEDYSLAVFLEYAQKSPQLVNIETNQVVSWKEVFGDNFTEISNTRKFDLIGLVGEPGNYRLN